MESPLQDFRPMYRSTTSNTNTGKRCQSLKTRVDCLNYHLDEIPNIGRVCSSQASAGCMLLGIMTFGCGAFCALPIITPILFLFYTSRRYDPEAVPFNKDTQLADSCSYPSMPYGGIRIEARFTPRTRSVAVYIFMDEFENPSVVQTLASPS